MIRRAMPWVIAALALSPAAAAPKAATGPAAPEKAASPVPALLEALKAEAVTWADSEPAKAPAPHAAVKKLSPTPANLAALRGLLGRRHSTKPLERLYVTYQLLLPFKAAPAGEAKRLLPLLPKITAPLRYQPMVKLTRRQLAACNVPKDGDLTNEIIERMHQAKMARQSREEAVIKHNALVRQIKAAAANVKILAASPPADRAVLKAIIAELNLGLATYTDGLAAITRHAGAMSKFRATFFYDKLSVMVPRVGNRMIGLTDPATLRGGGEKNSTFGGKPRMVGADLANVVNAVAKAAGKPAIEVPKAPPRPKPVAKKKPVQPKPK